MPRLKDAKEKGRRNEKRLIAWLLGNGFVFAVRAAGSLGPVDLVAFRDATMFDPVCPVVVQAKTNEWPGPRERASVIEVARKIGGLAVIARYNNFDRSPNFKTFGTRSKEWLPGLLA